MNNGHFQPGNPGRPKGALNKSSKELRERLGIFLEEKMEDIFNLYDQLEPREKLKFYTDLLPYVLPKLQPNNLLEEPNDEEVIIEIIE